MTTSNGNSTALKFKYQGQELEQNLGYNMHEFELRHYDAALLSTRRLYKDVSLIRELTEIKRVMKMSIEIKI